MRYRVVISLILDVLEISFQLCNFTLLALQQALQIPDRLLQLHDQRIITISSIACCLGSSTPLTLTSVA